MESRTIESNRREDKGSGLVFLNFFSLNESDPINMNLIDFLLLENVVNQVL